MAQLKSTIVQGALTVTGNVVANKLIKTGGTASQILMADGSVKGIGDLISIPGISITDTGTKPIVGDITASGHTITVTRIGLDDLGLASAYKYKGSVAAYANLPTTGNTEGDVYNVQTDGMNYAWTGSAWDALGGTVDLSNYVTLDGTQTITGNKTFTGNVVTSNNKFEIKANSNTDDSWIKLTNKSDSGYYAFGIRRPYDRYGLQLKIHGTDGADTYHDIWHAGNDGSGSTLDADLLDGKHASEFLTAESDTLQTVTTRGATTDKAIEVAGLKSTGNISLYAASGGTPYLLFQRGTETDSYNDWGVMGTGGSLYFKNRGAGSAWGNRVTFLQDGGITLDAGNLNVASGSATANSFINRNSSNDYVLLGGGGTKLVSEIIEAGSAGVDLSSYVTGSGTANYIPKFTAAGAIGNSEIIDNGSNVYPSANLGNSLGHASYVWDKLFVRQIELNRSQGDTYGRINFYSPAFYTWYEYMSPNKVKSPTSKNTPQYGEVTSWARRSLIESNSGYGWIWEACQNSNTATPVGKMALSSNTGNLTVAGSVTANGFKHSDATTGNNNYVLLAGGGTKAIDDITGTTYGADRGISLSNGNFGHSNTAITAQATKGLYKISYDAYGHITGTESFTLPTVNDGTLTIQKNGTNVATFTANQSGNTTANIEVPDPANYYWANVSVSASSSTATTPSVQKIGITGSTATDAAAAVTMEYDSGYKALKFVFA